MSATLAVQDWRPNAAASVIAFVAVALAISLFYTPVPFVLLIAIPASLYFVSRPYELLLAMVFLIPFNFVFSIGPVPLAVELLKVVAWIPFLIHCSAKGFQFKTSRYDKWLAIWAVLLLLSIIRSNNIAYTIKECVRFGSNLGLCYLVLNLVDTREKVHQLLRVLMYSAVLVACYGFYQFAIQDYGRLFWLVNPRVDTGFSPNRVAFWEWRNRIISVLTSELELAHYFNLCLPIAVGLWLTEGDKRLSSRWLWTAVSMFVGLILTFTFGAWLALAATVGLFFLLLGPKHLWKPMLVGTLVFAMVALLLVAGPLRPFVEDRALGTGVGTLAFDVVTRLDSWLFAVQVWWSHPWIGVGLGNFEQLEYDHEYIHSDWVVTGSTPQNAYVYLLALSGIPGFVAIFAILLGNIRSNLQLRRNLAAGPIGLALAFALTTTVFACVTDDGPLFSAHAAYLLWVLIGVSEVLWRLADAERIQSVPLYRV